MPTVDFDIVHVYDDEGEDNIPVEVILNLPGDLPVAIDAIIDTGASFSVFDKSVAELLEIDIPSGEEITLRTASNEEFVAYKHPVDLEFLGIRLNATVAFCPDWEDVENLLGMEGFLEHLTFGLKHAERTVLVTPV